MIWSLCECQPAQPPCYCTTLAETFSLQGQTVETVAVYVQQYLNEHGPVVWRDHLPEIEQKYQHSGNQAYGLYSQTLHQPLEPEG